MNGNGVHNMGRTGLQKLLTIIPIPTLLTLNLKPRSLSSTPPRVLSIGYGHLRDRRTKRIEIDKTEVTLPYRISHTRNNAVRNWYSRHAMSNSDGHRDLLARSAKLPTGIYILLALISCFFTMSKAISVSTAPRHHLRC